MDLVKASSSSNLRKQKGRRSVSKGLMPSTSADAAAMLETLSSIEDGETKRNVQPSSTSTPKPRGDEGFSERRNLVHYLSSSDEDPDISIVPSTSVATASATGPKRPRTGATVMSPEHLFSPLEKLKRAMARDSRKTKESVKRQLRF